MFILFSFSSSNDYSQQSFNINEDSSSNLPGDNFNSDSRDGSSTLGFTKVRKNK